MKHSIICWDSSFRNFFHLLPSLSKCKYDLNLVEVIFIEQRTRETALSVAANSEVKPVEEIISDLSSKLLVRLIYLNEPDDIPYHPGRLLNAGLKQAKGQILSTMDADILVPSNFFNVLDEVHSRGNVTVNLHRASIPYPCGVPTSNWKRQLVDYEILKDLAPIEQRVIPQTVGNKAPLISSKREFWEAIEYYDDGIAWSTACTYFGYDVSNRLKILLGQDSEVALPVMSIHPWHPTETKRDSKEAELLYSFQRACMAQSEQHGLFSVSSRKAIQNQYFEKYSDQILLAIDKLEKDMRGFTR